METEITKEAREELARATRRRYQATANREEKSRMLAEFIATTGYHPKSALRVLNQSDARDEVHRRKRPRLYDEAAREALIVLWEASDRVCGKRLEPLLRTLLPAIERHGHLQLEPVIRGKLLAMSAATIDRMLRSAKAPTKKRRPRRSVSAMRHHIPVRTFSDWRDPAPGSMEMDLVAHCGGSMRGSFIHTLVLTDLATGWTECAPLALRESTLIVQTLERLRPRLPFVLRALDTDNGTEFINDALVAYSVEHGIELTRSRPWLKNDQAWIEQKNGAVVRKAVGDHRYEGIAAAQCLARIYTALRFFVNFFQTSFKLSAKTREGASVTRSYHAPATPCERLLAHPTISDATKTRLREVAEMLDPIRLLEEIRTGQNQLAALAEGKPLQPPQTGDPDLARFLATLSTAWRGGEVRPTHAARSEATRYERSIASVIGSQIPKAASPPPPQPLTRVIPNHQMPEPLVTASKTTPDAAGGSLLKSATLDEAQTGTARLCQPPRAFVRRRKRAHAFVTVWPQITRWLEACPNMNAAMILAQLQALYPGRYESNQESSLHRRVRAWREVAVARGVVIGRRMYRVSPTHVWRRTRKDPFETEWPEICRLLDANPDQTAKDLFLALQVKNPDRYAVGQLRTLQRRLKAWRAEAVRKLVFDLQTQPLAGTSDVNVQP
jgi:hypothetical protein